MLMKQSEGFLLFITYLSGLATETLFLFVLCTLSRRGAATLAIYGILAILQGRQGGCILHENRELFSELRFGKMRRSIFWPSICGKSGTKIQKYPQLERSRASRRLHRPPNKASESVL